jgi:hypothetical protein
VPAPQPAADGGGGGGGGGSSSSDDHGEEAADPLLPHPFQAASRLVRHLKAVGTREQHVFKASASADEVKELRSFMEFGHALTVDLARFSVHCVAAYLKKLLRDSDPHVISPQTARALLDAHGERAPPRELPGALCLGLISLCAAHAQSKGRASRRGSTL